MTADELAIERSAVKWFNALREDPVDAELFSRFTQWHDAHPLHTEAWQKLRGNGSTAGPPAPWC